MNSSSNQSTSKSTMSFNSSASASSWSVSLEFSQQIVQLIIQVDYLKQRQEWTYTKVNQLSTSMVEFRKEIEAKASRVKSSPGAVLLDIIRHYASKLNEQLAKLRERGEEV